MAARREGAPGRVEEEHGGSPGEDHRGALRRSTAARRPREQEQAARWGREGVGGGQDGGFLDCGIRVLGKKVVRWRRDRDKKVIRGVLE